MENTQAVCVKAEVAQDMRRILEKDKLWDESRKLQKFGDDVIAIPVINHQAKLSVFQQNWPSAEIRKLHLPPSAKSKRMTQGQKLEQSVQSFLGKYNKSASLLKEVPQKWERHGDLVILSASAFISPEWRQLGDELWTCVADALSCCRLAQRSHISNDGFRTPKISMLLGNDGKVVHTDNGIKYSFDVTKCMFSSGNISEKLRIASWDCSQEVVVDLYAGIGYFTLPYLVHAKAKHVHACEWNPAAVTALRANLSLNGVEETRCTIHEGDNRQLNLACVADRVNLGLIPSSEEGWPVAVRVLKASGGVLHIHANVEAGEMGDNQNKKIDSASVGKSSQSLCNETFENERLQIDCSIHKDQLDSTKLEDEQSEPLFNDVSQEVVVVKQASNCSLWVENVCRKIEQLLVNEKKGKWECVVLHIERVKSYAPHILHVVLDIKCVATEKIS